MKATTTTRTSQFGRTALEENSEEQVRRRAYELYKARGRGDGHDLEDWLEAEAEISSRSRAEAA